MGAGPYVPRLAALVAIGAAIAGAGCCGDDEDEGRSGTFVNRTALFLHVFAGEGTSLYVPPGDSISLDLDGTDLVQIAFSPGQGATPGIQAAFRTICCCAGGGECKVETCGVFDATTTVAGALTVSYSQPPCGGTGGSCPYVYALTAAGPVAEGEVLSAALFPGAARNDVLPLPDASVVGGRIGVRVATVLREVDVLTGAALLAIDHGADDVALATDMTGQLAAVAGAEPPSAALALLSPGAAAPLPAIAARDGQVWSGVFAGDGVRDGLLLTFPPSARARDRLVLVVRNTRPAEEALQAYLAELGPGFPGLLGFLSGLPGYRDRLERMLGDGGLSLGVALWQQGRPAQRWRVPPVGSLGARAVALPFAPATPGRPVHVLVEALPTAWEIDAVYLGRAADDRVAVTELVPAAKLASDGTSPPITEAAPHRQEQGQYVDLFFDPPPPAGSGRRSFALAVRGHYELVRGGGASVDWGLLARRTLLGKDSFARYLRGERSEPRWSLCPKRMIRDLLGARTEGAESAHIACGEKESVLP
jgi:hypothetical protein